jgi:hypothetical protein
MYISPKASLARQREAQKARDNRAEIVKARSLGQITRRDLAAAQGPTDQQQKPHGHHHHH